MPKIKLPSHPSAWAPSSPYPDKKVRVVLRDNAPVGLAQIQPSFGNVGNFSIRVKYDALTYLDVADTQENAQKVVDDFIAYRFEVEETEVDRLKARVSELESKVTELEAKGTLELKVGAKVVVGPAAPGSALHGCVGLVERFNQGYYLVRFARDRVFAFKASELEVIP